MNEFGPRSIAAIFPYNTRTEHINTSLPEYCSDILFGSDYEWYVALKLALLESSKIIVICMWMHWKSSDTKLLSDGKKIVWIREFDGFPKIPLSILKTVSTNRKKRNVHNMDANDLILKFKFKSISKWKAKNDNNFALIYTKTSILCDSKDC